MKPRHTTKKNFPTPFIRLTLALALGLAAGRASAQTNASDTAAAYSSLTNGANFGFGFQPWVLTDTNSGGTFGGFYIGTSGHGDGNTGAYIDTAGKSFAMFANGAGAPYAIAYRGFSNALTASEVFKVKFQNNNISSAGPGYMGLCLRSDNNTNFTSFSSFILDSGTRFAFYFAGGQNDYYIWDSSGATDTGIGFTTKGLSLEFYLISADTYELIIKTADGSTVLGSFPVSNLAGNSGAGIITFAGFNFITGANQNAYFNSLQIASGSIVPPNIINLSPTNGTIFAPTNSFSFEVNSVFSTISSNGITLLLNGINQSNQLAVTGSGTSDILVTNTTPLQPNAVYTGSIIARDANGNLTTNNFSFNTWLTSPYNIYIEADDYNYSNGLWLDNFTVAQPNQTLGQYDYPGSNTEDYLEFDLTGTNHPNYYRTNDLPQIELATDVDHNNFAHNGFYDYDLGFIENGEWEDYTRHLSNTTYTVYARMASFGANPTMLMERTASPTVNSANQPRCALGTFVALPQTGDAQNWTFVPLKDFFSNPVQVNFAGTNTFRLTDIGGSGNYNVNYLVFVATTNTVTLRPYLAAGFPYPNAGPLQPDVTNFTFSIANRQTSVTSVQLLLNSNNVPVSVSNNAAGMVVSYSSPAYLPGGTNTLTMIFSDGSVSQTNTWQFTVVSLPILPAVWAQAASAFTTRGFSLQIAKGSDNATNADFPALIARAESQLSGTLTNSQTGLPYMNQALNGGIYMENNVVNYAIDPLFYGNTVAFSQTNAFPDIPAGGTNNVAMAAQMYVQLSPGIWQFAVFSDDGFKFTAGPTPANTNLVLGIVDGGRGGSETPFSFIVQTNGLYPMRLLYYKAQLGGGGVQLYTIDRTSGIRILLNDPNNVNSVKTFQTNAVAQAPPRPPTIGNIIISSSQIIIRGTNNVGSSGAGGSYHVLTSTNMALPLSSWTVLTNGTFDANGNFSSTNATGTGKQQFYILQVP